MIGVSNPQPEEISENDYNLNIPRYVDTFEIVSKLRKIADKYISLTARCAVCRK